MITNLVEKVKQLAPIAQSAYLQAIETGNDLFTEHGITTPLRMAHFLAQAFHETGGFRILRESMNYSAPRLVEIFGVNRHSAAVTETEAQQLAGHPEEIAERVYGLGNPRKARELGNTAPGDGFRYRGNGILQTTGRDNHRRMGITCGLDFESMPGLVTAPEHALKPALLEWTENDLNTFADKNDIRTITRKINGGYNGFGERQKWFDKLWGLLKEEDQPDEAWAAGTTDGHVRWLQKALNDLGADPELEVDGKYGPATTKAVFAFQESARLTVDGIAGPVTDAAIKLMLSKIR